MAKRSGKESLTTPPGWRLPEHAVEEATEKPADEMSDEELDAAIAQTKRELLAAARAETQARREATSKDDPDRRRYFAEFKRRPYWR
jgi:hypothetical protein